jgi:hypothetical protein
MLELLGCGFAPGQLVIHLNEWCVQKFETHCVHRPTGTGDPASVRVR